MRTVRILEEKDIVELLRIEIEKAGSQLAWAKKAGVNRTIANKVLHAAKRPGAKIIRALGLRTVVTSD
jgi:hypothetical protein